MNYVMVRTILEKAIRSPASINWPEFEEAGGRVPIAI
jgi:hypothetical protein